MEINENNFQKEVLDSKIPVLLDFWAPWCGPCRAIAPILETISQEHKNIKIAKINIDENSDLGAQYKIRSIPTLMLIQNGDILATRTGSGSIDDITAWIKDYIKS